MAFELHFNRIFYSVAIYLLSKCFYYTGAFFSLRQYLYRQSAEKLNKKLDLTASAANLIKLNISQSADKPNEN